MEYPKISLAAARVNANLTQAEAADLVGVSRITLQSYETGKTVPTITVCRKIEAVYKFPISCIDFEQSAPKIVQTIREILELPETDQGSA
ncbi:helix-turn-helix transcriptional regulator [Oscillospiraceae bacterium 38-13]